MTRSSEAIKRRAKKRGRTEKEEREASSSRNKNRIKRASKVIGTDVGMSIQKTTDDHVHITTGDGSNNHDERPEQPIEHPSTTGGEQKHSHEARSDILDEPGAWKCPNCNNQNFPSRDTCHSNSCDERRPKGVYVPPRWKQSNVSAGPNQIGSRGRHNPATSKSVAWPTQATPQQLDKNQELRRMYRESNGDGMTESDLARAKALLLRDSRKKAAKVKGKGRSGGKSKTVWVVRNGGNRVKPIPRGSTQLKPPSVNLLKSSQTHTVTTN